MFFACVSLAATQSSGGFEASHAVWKQAIIGFLRVFLMLERPHPPGPPPDDPQTTLRRKISEELVNAAWDSQAAKAVVKLNGDWLAILAQENPNHLQEQIRLLKGLGKYPQLAFFLQEHPEAAGLLAEADDPLLLAKSLEGDHYEQVASLYVQHPVAEDASALAQALENNRDLICSLLQRGLPGAEVLFVFHRDREGAAEYERWLREVLTAKLSLSDQELASMEHLLLNQGPEIRRRHQTDAPFRQRFRNQLWPALSRVAAANKNMFELYLDEPGVWDLPGAAPGGKTLERLGASPRPTPFQHDRKVSRGSSREGHSGLARV